LMEPEKLDLDKLVEILRKEILDQSLDKAFHLIEKHEEDFAMHIRLLIYGLLGCVGALTIISLVLMLKK
jgi:hypothetical protein